MSNKYGSQKVSYRINKELLKAFKEKSEEQGLIAGKLKRNWALNFMQTGNPNGQTNCNFKILAFKDLEDTLNDQVYFSTSSDKINFKEYCEKESVNVSDFIRTCIVNFIESGDPDMEKIK